MTIYVFVSCVVNNCLSAAALVAPEGGSLEWDKCWATVKWLTRATTTRTSPATLLLPSSTRWPMPSSSHQPTSLSSCLPTKHVSRYMEATVVALHTSVSFKNRPPTVEDSGESQSESENSVSDSVDENDDSVAEISRSFRSRQELCEQLNVNHMIQRIFLVTLDNSE